MQQATLNSGDTDNSGIVTQTAVANPTSNYPTYNFNGLIVEDVIVGDGQTVLPQTQIAVHYIGKLENDKGQVFDSSIQRRQPFEFIIGIGMVITGWEIGILGNQNIPPMKYGGKRRLTIPPEMGYGPQGIGPIPANSTLFFEVEVLN